MTEPLELGVDPLTKASHVCFHTLCQSFGRAEQMRQAALPQALPGLRGYPEIYALAKK
jgi:hypothetical protein